MLKVAYFYNIEQLLAVKPYELSSYFFSNSTST